jgi:flagellar L-ring protein precursor FlgH
MILPKIHCGKRSSIFCLLSSVLCLLTAACNTVPPTNVHQPMTVRPQPRGETPSANGSIYRPGVSRTLFEDRRARYIGDTMTIVISETTSASTKSSTNVSRSSKVSAAIPTVSGLPGRSLQGMNLSANSAISHTGEGDAAANNVFTGNIAVTVIEVLSNGNLLVSGEKQVSIGHGTEYIRLSGVVNPYFISTANTINSSNVADARIEYKETGAISEAQVMGWLARFFMSVLPF